MLLTDFLTTLKACQIKADIARKELSTRLTEYCDQIKGSNQYQQTPFLWFSLIYFETANLWLQFTDFHASEFYDFLVTILRGKPELPGFFQLIRNRISLKHLDWERLQYACTQYRIPITDEQNTVIKALYSYIYKAGIDGFNRQKLTTFIRDHLKTDKKTKDMHQLLILLDAQWKFWFYYPAYGLKEYYFTLTLNDSRSITEIIDIHDQSNTTLCNSRIFQVKDNPLSYTGYLIVPEQSSKQLYDYFNHYKQEGSICELEVFEVIDTRKSISLSFYTHNKGWTGLSENDQNKLIHSLKVKHPRRKKKKYENLYITEPFNREWQFTYHLNPIRVMSLFFELSETLTIDDLSNTLDSDFPLLSDLLANHTCQTSFVINRLIYEYSIDFYSIEIPLIPLKQLSIFLNSLLYAHLLFTESKIYIWAYLSPKEVEWIIKRLNWNVKGLQWHKSLLPLNRDWFDFENLAWYQPKILNQ